MMFWLHSTAVLFWLRDTGVLSCLQDMEVLCERCRDKALSVRKQALTSLTEVLTQFRDNSTVQR